jgi:transposase
MTQVHRRHDISDKVWSLLERHLPGREGSWGGIAKDNRQFIDAVFWIIRTGASWMRMVCRSELLYGRYQSGSHAGWPPDENAFLHLKGWRGIATRYAKNTASFLATVCIRCIALWAGIS